MGTGVVCAAPASARRQYCVESTLLTERAPRKPCQPPPSRYNCSFDAAKLIIMEAEQLNTLTAMLGDLKARTEDLRRYL